MSDILELKCVCMRCDIYVWRGGGLIFCVIKIASVFKLPYVNVCVWGGGGGGGGRGDIY